MNISPLKFIGRVSLIEELTKKVVNGTFPVVTLHGYGGVGKTRIANEIATRVTSEFQGSVYTTALEWKSIIHKK